MECTFKMIAQKPIFNKTFNLAVFGKYKKLMAPIFKIFTPVMFLSLTIH